MTVRLYYTDAHVQTFDAVVLACDAVDGRYHVRLDRTALYPTSGGQPFDTGRLGDATVVDVVDDDSGAVVHVVDDALGVGEMVRGEVDWSRRTDHMQQHTGQHILSAVLDDQHAAPTQSFHLGATASTIDVARDIGADVIGDAETQANRIVWDDMPVDVRFVSSDEALRMPLRRPSDRVGELRLVAIGDVDLSACGGTHVRSTGAVGLVAVVGSERFKGGTRITFACGVRALASHRRFRDVVAGAGRQLSAGASDIEPAIQRLQLDLREGQRLVTTLQKELSVCRAKEWRAEPQTIGPHRVVLRVDPASDAAMLKGVAQAIVSEPGLVAVLVGGGTPVPIVVARSADGVVDAGGLLRTVHAALGGRGGGRPEMAQGAVPAETDRIVAFVRQALAS